MWRPQYGDGDSSTTTDTDLLKSSLAGFFRFSFGPIDAASFDADVALLTEVLVEYMNDAKA